MKLADWIRALSLPPLPAGPRPRPSRVVLAVAGAICAIQGLGLWDHRTARIVDAPTLLRVAATILLVGLLAVYHVRARRHAAALARSERRYRALALETAALTILFSGDAARIHIANVHTAIAHVSSALAALLGLADRQTAPLARLVHPEDRPGFVERLAALAREAPRATSTARLLREDGSFIHGEVTFCRIEQADGSSESVVIVRDITERHREAEDLRHATQTAQRAQAEADQANRAKTEFLAHMSHEIRTPLNSVIGFSDLLLATPDLPAGARLHVTRIQAGGNALLTVVNDILDFSQVEAGMLELERRPFSLPGLLDECLSLVQQSAIAKSLTMQVTLGERLPRGVLGDATRLRQILLNLLNNAIKFTPKGSVLLDIRNDGAPDRIKFSIIDTGIGIAAKDQHRLFQRFAQVDGSIRRTYGGTGLGLAICRHLVGLMDGQIGVESEKDVGSTFWFTLPLVAAPLPRALDAPAATPARPATILLVEDVRINQDLVRNILEAAGHTVDIVGNGAEAIMAVQDAPYDVVLMDIQMPHVDGLAATRMIRKLRHGCAIVPIVAMTANVLPEQIAVARAAGMADIIHKPFSVKQIHATLARVLGDAPAPSVERDEGPTPDAMRGGCDIRVLAKLAGLIGDVKVKTLLASLAASLAARFDGDPETPEGRATLRRQAHASVAGAGMLGFAAFAVACQALDTSDEDDTFPARARALIDVAAMVIVTATALAAEDRTLEAMVLAA